MGTLRKSHEINSVWCPLIMVLYLTQKVKCTSGCLPLYRKYLYISLLFLQSIIKTPEIITYENMKVFSKPVKGGGWSDGSAGKGACQQAWWPGLIRDPVWWRKRSDRCRLSSDLHMHSMAHAGTVKKTGKAERGRTAGTQDPRNNITVNSLCSLWLICARCATEKAGNLEIWTSTHKNKQKLAFCLKEE